MTKEETLEAIEKARLAHIEQMRKINMMLRGREVKNPTSVAKTECQFGQWLYGDTKEFLTNILGLQFYEELDNAHEKWHTEYAKIYELVVPKKKGGFFSKLLSSEEVDEMALDKAKAYNNDLEPNTENLLRMLEKSKRRINAMSESKFA